MSDDELCKWMSKFIFEARKADGSEYSGESVYQLLCGLQRYLRSNGKPELDFLSDSRFRLIKDALDSKMKLLRRAGIGVEKKQAEPFTMDEEELLWEQGLLGEDSPDALRNCMIFMCGIYFALRGGSELRNLKFKQVKVCKSTNGDKYLEYHKLGSKNNSGGLCQRKIDNKVVAHYENKRNSSRDFVRLFENYVSKCPPPSGEGYFFLQSLPKPRKDRWYSSRVVGRNTLGTTVKKLCEAGGIGGRKTNH